MAGEVYKAYASSITTPIDQKRRKEVLLAPELTTYTLWYHYGDLDETPVRGVSYLATLSDGETRQGSLDAIGQARLTNVVKGPVTVSYQHDTSSEDDEAIRKAREEVKQALDAIVEQTRKDMAAEWIEWNQAGWLKRQYLLTVNNVQGQAVGAWKWLSGTVESIWQLAVLLYKTDREIRELRWLIITGQWEQLDRKIADYRGKGEQVLAAASETKELLILIFHDEATRKIITDFPAEWWAAIPPDEQAQLKSELGTEIAIDVIIAVLIAAFTAGAGSAMYGSAKWSQRIGKLGSKVVELLDKLEEAFRKLARALKVRKRRVTVVNRRADEEEVIETAWKAERSAEAARLARTKRLEELAKDPSQGGKITNKTRREAEVGLAMEDRGELAAPITRDPSGAAEFIDANGQKWDVKGFNSQYAPTGYNTPEALQKIQGEIAKGENVIVDTGKMSAQHVADLKRALEGAGLSGKVKFF